MAELLFEVGTEELPPGSISNLTNQIKENIINSLKENNISINTDDVKVYNTPRRIAIYIKGLPQEQEVKTVEIRGPDKEKAFDKNGLPTQAAIGFAKKYGLEPKDLTIKEVNNHEYVFVTAKVGGKKTYELLSEILPHSLRNTTGEKFMKWGKFDEKFARPIRWILAILDYRVIKFSYAGVSSDKYTYGHRFLSEKPIEISEPKNYEKNLWEEGKVLVENREAHIEGEIEDKAGSINGTPIEDINLITEVSNITEHPMGLLCSFEKEFLKLPECIIETVLKKHQRYFVIRDKGTGELKPNFVVITNGHEPGNNEIENKIRHGNEKVVRARLRDAQFFYEEDLKGPFTYEARGKQLSKITFQKGLGSMEEKVDRITKLAEYTYDNLETKKPEVTKQDVITTAKLCKLDLTTQMVFEFPELQGYIGSEYARKNNYNETVSKGISDHYYFPSFYEETHHLTLNGLIVGIADKIDNICCLFAIGKIPTGSTDPFALRRQAQAIITSIYYINRYFDQNIVNISDLIRYFKQSIANHDLRDKFTEEKENQIKQLILEKFMDNLETFDFDFEKDLIHAVCKTGDPLSNLILSHKKLTAIKELFHRPTENFKKFLVAAKRLVRIVEPNINGNINTNNLKTEYEKELLKKIDIISKKEHEDYNEFLNDLSTLTEPINTFFDKVLVNDPDPKIKQTRQALLKKGKDLFERICDFNKIIERS